MNKVLIAVIAILIGLYFVNFEGKDEASAVNDEASAKKSGKEVTSTESVSKEDETLKTRIKVGKSDSNNEYGGVAESILGNEVLREASRERHIKAMAVNDSVLFQKLNLSDNDKEKLQDLMADRIFYENNAKILMAGGEPTSPILPGELPDDSKEDIARELERILEELSQIENELLQDKAEIYATYIENRQYYHEASSLQNTLIDSQKMSVDQVDNIVQAFKDVDVNYPLGELQLMQPGFRDTLGEDGVKRVFDTLEKRKNTILSQTSQTLTRTQQQMLRNQLSNKIKFIEKYLN